MRSETRSYQVRLRRNEAAELVPAQQDTFCRAMRQFTEEFSDGRARPGIVDTDCVIVDQELRNTGGGASRARARSSTDVADGVRRLSNATASPTPAPTPSPVQPSRRFLDIEFEMRWTSRKTEIDSYHQQFLRYLNEPNGRDERFKGKFVGISYNYIELFTTKSAPDPPPTATPVRPPTASPIGPPSPTPSTAPAAVPSAPPSSSRPTAARPTATATPSDAPTRSSPSTGGGGAGGVGTVASAAVGAAGALGALGYCLWTRRRRRRRTPKNAVAVPGALDAPRGGVVVGEDERIDVVDLDSHYDRPPSTDPYHPHHHHHHGFVDVVTVQGDHGSNASASSDPPPSSYYHHGHGGHLPLAHSHHARSHHAPFGSPHAAQSAQSLVSLGVSVDSDSVLENDGADALRDEFDEYRDPGLEKMRAQVEGAIANSEDMVSQAMTRAFMDEDDATDDDAHHPVHPPSHHHHPHHLAHHHLAPHHHLHPPHHGGVVGGDDGAGVTEAVWNEHMTPTEHEVCKLWEVNDWKKKNQGANDDEKRAFMQNLLNKMVSSVRFGRIQPDDASRIIHGCAAWLGLQLSNDIPKTTLIVTGLRKNTKTRFLTESFKEFGEIQSAAVAPEKGFGLIRYHNKKSVDGALDKFQTEEIVVEDVGVCIKVLESETPLEIKHHHGRGDSSLIGGGGGGGAGPSGASGGGGGGPLYDSRDTIGYPDGSLGGRSEGRWRSGGGGGSHNSSSKPPPPGHPPPGGGGGGGGSEDGLSEKSSRRSYHSRDESGTSTNSNTSGAVTRSSGTDRRRKG